MCEIGTEIYDAIVTRGSIVQCSELSSLSVVLRLCDFHGDGDVVVLTIRHPATLGLRIFAHVGQVRLYMYTERTFGFGVRLKTWPV